MANIKALTEEDIYYFNKIYRFELIENNKYVLVYCANYPNRKTIHSAESGFSISTNRRKLKISKKAIDLWINKYKDKYTLPEVQNALSSLIVTYQNVSEESVDSQLSRKTNKIKEI